MIIHTNNNHIYYFQNIPFKIEDEDTIGPKIPNIIIGFHGSIMGYYMPENCTLEIEIDMKLNKSKVIAFSKFREKSFELLMIYNALYGILSLNKNLLTFTPFIKTP